MSTSTSPSWKAKPTGAVNGRGALPFRLSGLGAIGLDGPPPDETVWSGPMLGFLLSVVIAIPIIFAVLMLTSFGVLRDTNDSAASSITTVVSEATQSLDTVLTTSELATGAADPEPAAAVGVEAAASADAAPQLGQVYVVIAGDVLHQIAVRFAVTTDALVAYNALSNPNALRIGQELRIPPPGYQPPDPADAESTDFATGPLSPRG